MLFFFYGGGGVSSLALSLIVSFSVLFNSEGGAWLLQKLFGRGGGDYYADEGDAGRQWGHRGHGGSSLNNILIGVRAHHAGVPECIVCVSVCVSASVSVSASLFPCAGYCVRDSVAASPTLSACEGWRSAHERNCRHGISPAGPTGCLRGDGRALCHRDRIAEPSVPRRVWPPARLAFCCTPLYRLQVVQYGWKGDASNMTVSPTARRVVGREDAAGWGVDTARLPRQWLGRPGPCWLGRRWRWRRRRRR